MSKIHDVVVIGAGVIGCATARELSKFALNIAVLEANEDICTGQSKANTALVHGGYDPKPGTLKAKFNALGSKMMPRICEQLEVPYQNNTAMVISFDDEQNFELEKLLERGRENGVPDLSIIDRAEVLKREPNISKLVNGALLVGNGAIVCPYELTQAYAENAANNGVLFYRDSKVVDIIYEKDGTYRIVTATMEIVGKAVINCAGTNSDFINNLVSQRKYTIHPRRGEYYLLDKKYENEFHATIFQLPTKMGKGVLIAPTADGTILIGPSAEDISDKEDKKTTAYGLETVLEMARKTWPDIPTRGYISTFAGVRAHCGEDDFILGEVADAPLFFNALGIESPGLSAAPAIGQSLAEAVASALKADFNPNFEPKRKSIPKFRDMSNEKRAEQIAENPTFAHVVCRCENITELEIREAIARPVGVRTLDGIKHVTRAGMGRCQGGFCTSRIIDIMCDELGIDPMEVTKSGKGSELLSHYLFGEGER